jgi:hypothetical protein
MYRSASREGLMGVTCLIDFRSHQFDVDGDGLDMARTGRG